MTKRRIGAYGGTFDPIHFGHIEIAHSVLADFELDELLVIPAYKPPHKSLEAISDSRHRYEMCSLAFAGEPRISVSKMEIELPERPYTINTIERLQATYGEQTVLYFVMGADSFEEITTWRDYQRLLSITNIVVAARAGREFSSRHLPEELQRRVVDLRRRQAGASWRRQEAGCFIYLTDAVHCDLSSTEIRRRVQAGLSLAGLTDERVIAYIESHGLYRQR
jgi:nicotinate-nucleotide adenylyltransferase